MEQHISTPNNQTTTWALRSPLVCTGPLPLHQRHRRLERVDEREHCRLRSLRQLRKLSTIHHPIQQALSFRKLLEERTLLSGVGAFPRDTVSRYFLDVAVRCHF